MKEAVLVDTGPIVAFLNSRDRHHEWSKETFAEIEAPVMSCEAVLSEACFLLRTARGGSEAVLKLVDRGLVRLPFRLEAETGPIRRLLSRYSSVPMSLVLLTLDRDFKVYRKHGRNVIPIRTPDGL